MATTCIECVVRCIFLWDSLYGCVCALISVMDARVVEGCRGFVFMNLLWHFETPIENRNTHTHTRNPVFIQVEVKRGDWNRSCVRGEAALTCVVSPRATDCLIFTPPAPISQERAVTERKKGDTHNFQCHQIEKTTHGWCGSSLCAFPRNRRLQDIKWLRHICREQLGRASLFVFLSGKLEGLRSSMCTTQRRIKQQQQQRSTATATLPPPHSGDERYVTYFFERLCC